jgi:hypothetical protein
MIEMASGSAVSGTSDRASTVPPRPGKRNGLLRRPPAPAQPASVNGLAPPGSPRWARKPSAASSALPSAHFHSLRWVWFAPTPLTLSIMHATHVSASRQVSANSPVCVTRHALGADSALLRQFSFTPIVLKQHSCYNRQSSTLTGKPILTSSILCLPSSGQACLLGLLACPPARRHLQMEQATGT